MEFLGNIASLVAEHAWDPIARHLGYLFFYKRNIKKLEGKFDELDDLQKDVRREVDAAARERLEEVKSVVKAWLRDVNKVEEEVKRLKDRASVIANKLGFLHISSHYKLGREAASHAETIDDLISKASKFDRVSHSRPPPSTADSLLYNEDYAVFESRKSLENKILQALKDGHLHLVGLCGMGGVGKTTLVKEVAKKAKNEHGLFDEVVMVTVSQNPDLNRIQTGMAESLGLRLEEESAEVRAAKLAERLKSAGKRVLVILDDLWEMLDLSKVRIPRPQMGGNSCRVVITTRNRDVCERMECREIVELMTLSEEESWNLFKSRAGGDVDQLPTVGELAKNVAKECAGLPLALVVLGTALKGKKREIWETVLMQLKKSVVVDLPGVSKQVFQSIELSFNFLETDVAKWCFLHCCLYPEDYDIETTELMPMLVGGGFLDDVETLNEAESRLNVLIDQLKACGLLLEGRDEGHVKMHDIVRDVAIRIGERDQDGLFYAGQGLKEWPRTIHEGRMGTCKWLSLMFNDIEDLPPDPMKCPKLETLILRGNSMLSSIPETFFQHMGSLRVFDLSYTSIKKLPESLSCLTSLRELNLSECHEIEDISPLTGLKMLEILFLDCTSVSIVPEEEGGWQNLRCVYLISGRESYPAHGSNYFSKILPRCRKLERLFMTKFEGSFRELASLRFLTHLFISRVVDSNDPLSHELGSPDSWPDQLLAFGISFLQDEEICIPMAIMAGARYLELMGTKPLAGWVKRLLQRTRELRLEDFWETELISINSNIPLIVFSNLKCLYLNNWSNLTKLLGDGQQLLHEQVPLNQLEEMIVANCPRLTSLIPTGLWQRSMQQLSRIHVPNCSLTVELFPCDHKAHHMTELLPRLRSLTVYNLPRLDYVLQLFQCLPKLRKVIIEACGVRCVVAFEMEMVEMADPFPRLEKLDIIDCQEMSEMISPGPGASLQAPCCFQNLVSLSVSSCPRLRHLFSSKQAKSMQHLNELDIEECIELETVVISTENKDEASTSVADHASYSFFPQLRKLQLIKLPQLTAFYHPTALPIEWSYLRQCFISDCPNLQKPLLGPHTFQRLGENRYDGDEEIEEYNSDEEIEENATQDIVMREIQN